MRSSTLVPGRRGFTLLEMIVSVAILILLAGLLAPFLFTSKIEAQAAQVAATVRSLRTACARYYFDNGHFPKEIPNSADPRNDRNLWTDPGLTPSTWKGPYILEPLGHESHPEGGVMEVLEDLTSFDIPHGFTVGGVPLNKNNAGCALIYQDISETICEKVDELLDAGEEPASSRGNVVWGPVGAGGSKPGPGGINTNLLSLEKSGNNLAILVLYRDQ